MLLGVGVRDIVMRRPAVVGVVWFQHLTQRIVVVTALLRAVDDLVGSRACRLQLQYRDRPTPASMTVTMRPDFYLDGTHPQ